MVGRTITRYKARLGPPSRMGRRRQRSRKILARYGWQCQFCRRVDVLQIHPIQPGSCLGDNAADKLIAVCVASSKTPSPRVSGFGRRLASPSLRIDGLQFRRSKMIRRDLVRVGSSALKSKSGAFLISQVSWRDSARRDFLAHFVHRHNCFIQPLSPFLQISTESGDGWS